MSPEEEEDPQSAMVAVAMWVGLQPEVWVALPPEVWVALPPEVWVALLPEEVVVLGRSLEVQVALGLSPEELEA